MSVRGRTLVAGGIFLVFGLALVFVLIPYGVDEPRRIQFEVLSPSYYPRLIAIAMILLGAAIVARGYFGPREVDDDSEELRSDVTIRLAGVFGILLAIALVLPYGGFILTSGVGLTALLLLAGERKPRTIAALSILLPLGLYFFFTKLANIPIPNGVLSPIFQGF